MVHIKGGGDKTLDKDTVINKGLYKASQMRKR
jgi:hypothetical protein